MFLKDIAAVAEEHPCAGLVEERGFVQVCQRVCESAEEPQPGEADVLRAVGDQTQREMENSCLNKIAGYLGWKMTHIVRYLLN